MINQRVAELTVGSLMLAGILALVVLAFKVSGLTSYVGHEGYYLTAQFDNIGDLKARAPVSIAGVRIGQVQSIHLDPETYRADVRLFINNNSKSLPIDTSAYIYTEGLLGGNYISLVPGFGNGDGEEVQFLKNGDRIETTYSALILEDMIGKFLFKIGNDDNDSKE